MSNLNLLTIRFVHSQPLLRKLDYNGGRELAPSVVYFA